MCLKLLAVTIISFLTIFAPAQIKKGSTFLGGDISFSSEKGTSSNNMNYNTGGVYFLPVVGKAILENRILGITLLYYHQNSDVSLDFNDLKQWIYGTGVFIREYYPLAKTKFSLFVQAHVSAEHNKVKQAYNTIDKIETNTFSINASAHPGVSFSLSRKLQLESGFSNLFGLRYFHRETTSGTLNPVTSSANGIDLYASAENITRFNVGFRLMLSKK